jgi:hypothetical protein
MGASLGRVISDYRSLVEICRARAQELELSRLEVDRLGGFAAGYASVVLGPDRGGKRRNMWPRGLEIILATLGLKILVIEDEVAAARTLSLRKPVTASHQRFNNKSRSKSSSNIEAPKIAPPEKERPPQLEMRSHLRIVRPKRRYSNAGF